MSEFIEYLKEVFEPFGSVQARRMFGGYGIYHDGLMFGLVTDETLYLKTDASTVEYFAEKDLTPFEYHRAGKVIKMSYYQAPEEVLEDSQAACLWANRAYEAALRAKSVVTKQSKK